MNKINLFFMSALLLAPFSHAQEVAQDNFKATIESLSEDEKIEILMGAGDPVRLHNFKTAEKETIYRVDQVSSEKFREFLPPLEEVKALYGLYISHGLAPYEAYNNSMSDLMRMLAE